MSHMKILASSLIKADHGKFGFLWASGLSQNIRYEMRHNSHSRSVPVDNNGVVVGLVLWYNELLHRCVHVQQQTFRDVALDLLMQTTFDQRVLTGDVCRICWAHLHCFHILLSPLSMWRTIKRNQVFFFIINVVLVTLLPGSIGLGLHLPGSPEPNSGCRS